MSLSRRARMPFSAWIVAVTTVMLLAGVDCRPLSCSAFAAGPVETAATPAAPQRTAAGNLSRIRRLAERSGRLQAGRSQRDRQIAAQTPRLDAGIAGSENFTVLAPAGDFLADRILERAETLRRDIAMAWLGTELPVGQEFTHIHFQPEDETDRGWTLLCGPLRELPGHHRMWLETSTALALSHTLAHEMAHVVLSARFPGGMPAWVNEGIACRYDDPASVRVRRQLLADQVSRNAIPDLAALLDRRRLPAGDQQGYAAACSLTDMLLQQGSRETLLQFTAAGMQQGWGTALRQHYRIASVPELQRQWERHLRTSAVPPRPAIAAERPDTRLR